MVGESEGDPLVRADDYRDLVQVGEPRVDPNGDRVAFVRTVPDGDEAYEATIYMVPIKSGEVRRFTVAEGKDSEPRFSPTGDRLAVVSTRATDDDRPQLWVVPTDGGEGRKVTNVVGGVTSIEWSPDGTRIVFAQRSTAEDRMAERDLGLPEAYDAERPDPRVIDRTIWRSSQSYFDGKRSHVYVIDLDSEADEITRLTEGDHDYWSPTWGDAATVYYGSRPRNVDDPDDTIAFEVIAHDLETNDTTVVTTSSGMAEVLAATEDGRIAYPYTPEQQASLRQTDLKVYDRETDREYTPTADLDRTVGYDTSPEWGPDGEFIYFSTPDRGSVLYRRVRWDATTVETVAGEGKHVSGGSPGPPPMGDHGTDGEDPLVVYTASEADHRGDVFAVVDGMDRRLTTVNADYLAGKTLAAPEELDIDGPTGEIQGWLLLPPGPARDDGTDQFPLVVEVHGGPHTMWTTSGTMFHEFQTLAARGYAVFWLNPRGSSGYGEEFMRAIERNWGAVTLADIESGLDRVSQHPAIDEDQLFLTGGSFGGYVTAWAVGQTDRFVAAVSQRGVYDLAGFYGSTDGAYRLIEGDFATVPWAEPEFLHAHSPVSIAHEVETPTLVIHGEEDYRTPINTAEQFYRYLRKADVDTRLVQYPREGHELSRSGEPAHVVDRIERIARWFDGYSDAHDAPPALERERNADLSANHDAGTALDNGDVSDGTQNGG